MLPALPELLKCIQSALPKAQVTILENPCTAEVSSLLVGAESFFEVMHFLKNDPALRMDYLSNLTGVDVLPSAKEPVHEGYLEVVYHLYSMELRHGALVVRTRTKNRTTDVALPSVVSLWRSAEFQEREVYDLYGVVFAGHPDLRRILMWDEFEHYPMRKDYVEPDDYEYEPTAHGDILTKAQKHTKPQQESIP